MKNHSLTLSESDILVATEKFIDDLLICKMRLDEFSYSLFEIKEQLNFTLKNEYCYSQKVIAFIEACLCCEAYIENETVDENYYKKFIQVVHLYKNAIENEQKEMIKQEIRNEKKLVTYAEQLINHYSRLLVVRIDLGYLKHQVEVKIHTVKVDLLSLTREFTLKRGCFKELQGFAWALEQGEDKGYHCHLLLMFDGHKHQKDYYLAKQVGELWQQITHNQGIYFNCHETSYKNKFKKLDKLGIGMIHRNEPVEIDNFLRTVKYLVNPEKTNQFLRVKTTKRMRTFGTGTFFNLKRRRLGKYDLTKTTATSSNSIIL